MCYDPNGNALTVTRTGETAGGPLASLTMTYDGNRLSSVTDSGSEEAGTHSYAYDASGNLTHDGRKRLEFTHNVLNLPMSVRERDASGQHMTGDITYTYLGDGAAVVNLSAPQSASTGAFILEQNGYHPFGTKIDLGCNLSTNRWRYAGKEEQDIAGMDLRLLDFGARFYDPYTLRWNAVDPLAHKYFDLSPYNYCGNDPVNMVDPDGEDIYTIDEDGFLVSIVSDSNIDRIDVVDAERSIKSSSKEYNAGTFKTNLEIGDSFHFQTSNTRSRCISL